MYLKPSGGFGRPSHATLVAYAALFIALGGVSYAAAILPKNSVGSKQIKSKSVKGSDLANNAVSSPKVKDGSLLSKDFAPGQLVSGDPGPQGPKGDPGTNGTDGATGPAGPFPSGNAPRGATIRGTYAARERYDGGSVAAFDSISFGFQLESAPVAHYIKIGATPPVTCPGTASNPQASPGHLCVYESLYSSGGAESGERDVFNPASPTGSSGAASRWGAAVRAEGTNQASVFGVWAVTAP